MRHLIFSDVHANLEALEAALELAKTLDIDKAWCLGDTVGYGANPYECIVTVSNYPIGGVFGFYTLQGNHDEAVGNNFEIENFNAIAYTAAMKHREMLSKTERDWLRRLPPAVMFPEPDKDLNVIMSHGAITRKFGYVLHNFDAFRQMVKMLDGKFNLMFCGHSHSPGLWRLDRGRDLGTETEDVEGRLRTSVLTSSNTNGIEFKVLPEDLMVVDIGSIGQPRDRDPRSCFVVLDTDAMSVKFHRVEYNIEKAQKKIRDAGLPGRLADRLAAGE